MSIYKVLDTLLKMEDSVMKKRDTFLSLGVHIIMRRNGLNKKHMNNI